MHYKLKRSMQLHIKKENDVTEQLKRIIQANASLHQELLETSSTSKCLVKFEDFEPLLISLWIFSFIFLNFECCTFMILMDTYDDPN